MQPLRFILLPIAAGLAACRAGEPSSGGQATAASASCRGCHASVYDSYAGTAHFATSAQASAATIHADFGATPETLRTNRAGVYFTLERRNGAFYQTGHDDPNHRTVTERFDLVVGSGRVGQSYLYWKDGFLFELPVSSLSANRSWINSPGYADGVINFTRPVVPRCLECHATYFRLVMRNGHPSYTDDYELGIGCSRCHTGGEAHAAYHASHPGDTTAHAIVNPAHLSRDRQVDVCALCHSGARDATQPPFSFAAGDRLADYFAPMAPVDSQPPDVHGNQVGLLMESRCFRSSPGMTCSTCHDVHRQQRDVAALAERCLQCHTVDRHPRAREIGSRLKTECVNCHMPTSPTKIVWFNKGGERYAPSKRTHRIAVYPEATARVLGAPRGR